MMFASTTTTEHLLRSSGLPTHRQPTHPGQVLRKYFLKPSGVTQVKAAKDLSIKRARLSEIINGKRRITEETALLLERYLGCLAATWLNLQHAYDLAAAIKALPPKRLQSIHPLNKLQTA
jgi:addiction module HigA family antidote